jgi:hypothetical protein
MTTTNALTQAQLNELGKEHCALFSYRKGATFSREIPARWDTTKPGCSRGYFFAPEQYNGSIERMKADPTLRFEEEGLILTRKQDAGRWPSPVQPHFL